MLVAIGLGLGFGLRADAYMLAPLAQVIDEVRSGALHLGVGVTPSPTPSPAPRTRSGGPILFNMSGSLTLGRTSTASTYGAGGFFTPSPSPSASASAGPFPFQPATSTNQTQSEAGVGLAADFSRRTATTLTDFRISTGLNLTGRATVGIAQLLYSTPKYSIGYGPQQIDGFGQLQMGTTLRGFTFILPERYGRTTYYEGPAIGANDEQDRVYGVLAEQARGSVVYEEGFNYAVGPETGVAKTLIFGAATARGGLGLIGEGAWQTRSGGDGDPHGIAAQFRLDDALRDGSCSTTLRSVPNEFVTFSSGEIFGDKFAGIYCQGTQIPVYATATWEKTGDGTGGLSEQDVETVGYSPALRFGGFAINLQRQNGSSGGLSDRSNAASVSFQTQILQVGTILGAQTQRTISAGAVAATESLLASLHRSFGHLSFGISGQVQKQNTQNGVPSPEPSVAPLPAPSPVNGIQHGLGFNVARQWRKTTVQVGETITRTQSNVSDALQRTPLVNVSRQISPVISITASLGYQILTDSLNPSSNGRSRLFSISLSAPFAYGNTNVSGRPDPRLPATIVGKVLFANPSSSGASTNLQSLVGSGGVGNVAVTLDNKYVERTDLSGSFQFSFVPPGQHQISIDTSSMPRGYTASTPVQTVDLQGGQSATVSFSIGTFGGVLGHVYGLDPAGNPLPLQNVKLRVDGGAYAQTDTTGSFGFGGLAPGEHEVSVIPQSVPATADFAPADLVKKVTVSNGQYTTLDFRAQSLGSISGQILYAKDMAPDLTGGVLNAYVVAEPGEHAAIDQDDGSFIIDNLPAGDYTISVDPETIDAKLGAAPDSVTVHLGAGEHYAGLLFSVGRFEKKVVFSVLGGATPAPALPSVRLSEGRLPPHGTTAVAIDAPASATGVEVTAFDKKVALTYDKSEEKWVGEIEVPATAKAGEYTISGSARGVPAAPSSARLTVDPKLPLVIVQYLPANAGVGQTVTVRARFLVDVHPGDKITWQDGTETVLGKPVSGRVFTFRKVLTLLPLHGLLLTPKGSLPIELL